MMVYQQAIKPLKKLASGRYLSFDGRLELYRTDKGLWKAYAVNHKDPDWYMLPSLQPRAAKSLKELVSWLERPLLESRPIVLRPLHKRSEVWYEDDGKGGETCHEEIYYTSADRRLQFRNEGEGWEVDGDWLLLNPVIQGADSIETQLAAIMHDNEKWQAWQSQHGLDYPHRTLKELIAKTQTALENDPPHLLFLPAEEAAKLTVVWNGKS